MDDIHYIPSTLLPTGKCKISDLSEDILSTSKPNLNEQMPKPRKLARNALKIGGDGNTTAL